MPFCLMSSIFLFFINDFFIETTLTTTFFEPLSINGRNSMKVHLYIVGFSLPLTIQFLVTFPRNLAQTFRRYRFTSIRKIFLPSFCILQIMTHFVVKKEFSAFCYSFEYNLWDMNLIGFLFCMTFPTIESKLDNNFQRFLLSNIELLHKNQQKTCVSGYPKISQKSFDILPVSSHWHHLKTSI